MTLKCPPREDVSDGWAYCRVHKQWHRDQTGHLVGRKTIPPGNRGTQCGAWNVDTELIKKMEEFGTKFKEACT
jgi:hypothetical protein